MFPSAVVFGIEKHVSKCSDIEKHVARAKMRTESCSSRFMSFKRRRCLQGSDAYKAAMPAWQCTASLNQHLRLRTSSFAYRGIPSGHVGGKVLGGVRVG